MTAPPPAAHRAAASAILPGQAGTGPLITSGHFPHRGNFTSQYIHTTAGVPCGTPTARTDPDTAPAAGHH